jgi:signal transduction histidine kinase
MPRLTAERTVPGAGMPEVIAAGDTGFAPVPGPETLARQASRSVFIGALAYRVVATLAPVLVVVSRYGLARVGSVVALAMALTVVNVTALVAVRRRPALDLARLRTPLVVDLSVAFAVNVLSGLLVPGSVVEPYHDVFWFYLVGCVVLMTAGWGVVAGVVTVVATTPLQVVMDRTNGLPSFDPAVFLGRLLWLVTGLVMAVVILWLVGASARQATLQGIEAGQATERARILRSMHDTVLQTLEAMALDNADDAATPEDALARLRRTARAEAMSLRHALDGLTDAPPGRLCDALAVVAGGAEVQGVHVDLVVAELPEGELSKPRVEALRDAVREALRNIAKHSGALQAVVRVDTIADGVQVVVRDHGRGFAAMETAYGFGIRESILGRLSAVDGSATVESWPGRGTRVRLWVPA